LARFVNLQAKIKQEFLDVERTQAVCCCNIRSECQSVFARSPAIYSHSPFSTLVENLVPQNLLYMSLFVFHCDIFSKFFKQQFSIASVETSNVVTRGDNEILHMKSSTAAIASVKIARNKHSQQIVTK